MKFVGLGISVAGIALMFLGGFLTGYSDYTYSQRIGMYQIQPYSGPGRMIFVLGVLLTIIGIILAAIGASRMKSDDTTV
jgi:uncharacterized membrane protein